jgi:hypothetical protein
VQEDGRMTRTGFPFEISFFLEQTTNARAIAALACEVSLAADAPANDLALAKKIGKYKDLDSDVGQAAFAALS